MVVGKQSNNLYISNQNLQYSISRVAFGLFDDDEDTTAVIPAHALMWTHSSTVIVSF